jgi:hypothetical protein
MHPFHSAVLTPRLVEEFQQRNRRKREEPQRCYPEGSRRVALGPVEDALTNRRFGDAFTRSHIVRLIASLGVSRGRLGDPFMQPPQVGLPVVGRVQRRPAGRA